MFTLQRTAFVSALVSESGVHLDEDVEDVLAEIPGHLKRHRQDALGDGAQLAGFLLF